MDTYFVHWKDLFCCKLLRITLVPYSSHKNSELGKKRKEKKRKQLPFFVNLAFHREFNTSAAQIRNFFRETSRMSVLPSIAFSLSLSLSLQVFLARFFVSSLGSRPTAATINSQSQSFHPSLTHHVSQFGVKTKTRKRRHHHHHHHPPGACFQGTRKEERKE
jgi:hypothetical protein